MDERERMLILAEILDERLPYIQSVLDEWSVPESDALSYAQAKDLIWHLVAPLGISLIGYRAAERALDDYPGDSDAQHAHERFTSVGKRIGDMLDDALQTANSVRS
jgi:hypothetical protein